MCTIMLFFVCTFLSQFFALTSCEFSFSQHLLFHSIVSSVFSPRSCHTEQIHLEICMFMFVVCVHICVCLGIAHADDCHEISCECVLIATAQLYLADLAVMCAWLLASSIQLQLPTVGAWRTAEDGVWVLVGAQRGVIHSTRQPTFAWEEDQCLRGCFSRCG